MTERFGDFVRYDPLQAQHGAAVGRPPLLLLLALNRLRRACIAGNRRGCRLSAAEPRGRSLTTPGPS